MIDRSDILFVGWGRPDGVTHYRTVLPAREMGAEWVVFGMDGKPVAGEGTRKTHRIIVVQICWNEWQLRIVQRMKLSGAKVVFNVDDWIKGLGKTSQGKGDHASLFSKRSVQSTHDRIAKLTDGILVSTPWLADKFRALNPNIAIARNGIDPDRYTRWMDVERDMGTIVGWAGGTGHREALRDIAAPVSEVINANPGSSLWIVGQDESDLFSCPTFHVKWSDMELYPQQLACFDINLAPAQVNDFYRAKSQLRLYEAMTLGTPSIVHPMYDEVGAAGMIADGPRDWAVKLSLLVGDEQLRSEGRKAALEQAKDVTIHARISEWTDGLDRLVPRTEPSAGNDSTAADGTVGSRQRSRPRPIAGDGVFGTGRPEAPKSGAPSLRPEHSNRGDSAHP